MMRRTVRMTSIGFGVAALVLSAALLAAPTAASAAWELDSTAGLRTASEPLPGAQCEIPASTQVTCWQVPADGPSVELTLRAHGGVVLVTVEAVDGAVRTFTLQKDHERTLEVRPGAVVRGAASIDSATLWIRDGIAPPMAGAQCDVLPTQSVVCWGLAAHETVGQQLTVALTRGAALVTVEDPGGAVRSRVLADTAEHTFTLHPGGTLRLDAGAEPVTLVLVRVAPAP